MKQNILNSLQFISQVLSQDIIPELEALESTNPSVDFTSINAKLDNITSVLNGIDYESDSIGVNQIFEDVTLNRASGTSYINTTNKPIMVVVSCINDGSYRMKYSVTIDNIPIASSLSVTSSQSTQSIIPITFLVPQNSVYSLNIDYGSVYKWVELR